MDFSIMKTKLSKLKIIDSLDNNMEEAKKILKNYLSNVFCNLKSRQTDSISKLKFQEVILISIAVYQV